MPRNKFGELLIPSERIAAWQRRFPSFEPSSAQLIFSIRALAQRINDNANEWLAPFGLTATKFNYLAVICSVEREGMTLLEIGALVRTSSGTVTTMVKVLERDGFVKRSVNRDDGRSIRIKPTSKGRAAIENAWALHHRNIETIVAGMSRAKRAELLTSVVALGGRLEDHKPQRGR